MKNKDHEHDLTKDELASCESTSADKEIDYKTEQDKKDEDIEQAPKKEVYGGVETEEYDILPELDEHDELKAELEEKEGIELSYSFNGEEVKEGLTVYQAAALLKKNLIYSGVLIVVFAVYMVNIIKNPGEAFSMFLAAMCVAILAFIWILPKLHIKKTAKAADMEDMKFSMVVYDNCIKIGEENGSYIVTYEKEITNIFETANLYLICAGKERLFILPKRCVPRETEEKLQEIFKSAMGERFIVK